MCGKHQLSLSMCSMSQSQETIVNSWWRHQMETFSALLALCAGNSPVAGEFLAQRPGMGSLDVFYDLSLNKRLSKQSWDWWFETLSHPLWRHCNVLSHTMKSLSDRSYSDHPRISPHILENLVNTVLVGVMASPMSRLTRNRLYKLNSFIYVLMMNFNTLMTILLNQQHWN